MWVSAAVAGAAAVGGAVVASNASSKCQQDRAEYK